MKITPRSCAPSPPSSRSRLRCVSRCGGEPVARRTRHARAGDGPAHRRADPDPSYTSGVRALGRDRRRLPVRRPRCRRPHCARRAGRAWPRAVHRGTVTDVSARRNRSVSRPGGARPRHRTRGGLAGCRSSDSRSWPPPRGDRSCRGQRPGDPLLCIGRIPSGRRTAPLRARAGRDLARRPVDGPARGRAAPALTRRLANIDFIERLFDNGQMLDVAIRKADGTTAVDLGRRCAPPLPVHPALCEVLPGGLRRGSTIAVSGSMSLLLATLGAASAVGAWCALVGLPYISAESAAEYGVDLSRLAIVPSPGSGWATAVGALLDAVDIVAARPPRLVPGDVRRLSARARTRESVLLPYGEWPGADVRLRADGGQWSGIGEGTGRLRARRLDVNAQGRGRAAHPRTVSLWLPASGGGLDIADPIAPMIELAG